MSRYIIPGSPMPLARARQGNSRAYDEQRFLKIGLRDMLSTQHGSQPLFPGPIILSVSFFFPLRPYLLHPKQTEQRLKIINSPHFSRPDLSYLVRFIEELCIGITYQDNCAIYSIIASKTFSDNPRTEIDICQY